MQVGSIHQLFLIFWAFNHHDGLWVWLVGLMIVKRNWLLCIFWLRLRWLRKRHLTRVLLSKLSRNTWCVLLLLLVTYDGIVVGHQPILLVFDQITVFLHRLFRKNWAYARTKHWRRLVVLLQIIVLIDCEQVGHIAIRFFAALTESGEFTNGNNIWVFGILVLVSYRLVHHFFVSALLDQLIFFWHW